MLVKILKFRKSSILLFLMAGGPSVGCDLSDMKSRLAVGKGIEGLYHELVKCEKKVNLTGALYWELYNFGSGREQQVEKYEDLNLPINLDYLCEAALRGYRLGVMELSSMIGGPLPIFPIEEHYEVGNCLDNILLVTDKTYVDTKMVKECLDLGIRKKNLNACF